MVDHGPPPHSIVTRVDYTDNLWFRRTALPKDAVPRYGLDFGFGSDPSFAVKVYVALSKVHAAVCKRYPSLPACK